MCGERFKWQYVVTCSMFIALGGFLFGYDVGSSNGVKEMEGFREYFNLSSTEGNSTCRANDDEKTSTLLGLVVSLFSLGSLFGALLGGPLSDWAGRRAALLTGALLCATGIIVQTSSVFIWMLLIGKVWTGLGNGLLLQVGPLYIAELAPKQFRGKLVSLTSGAGNTGTLIGALVDLGVEKIVVGWRIALGVQFAFAFVMIMSSFFLPESPRWHIKKNRTQKAIRTLRKIYSDNEDIVLSHVNEISASFNKSQHLGKQFWRTVYLLDIAHRIFLGFSFLFLGRACGLQLAVYFSVSIFCKVGVSGFVGGAIIGFSVVIGYCTGLIITDKLGRKVIILVGYLIMIVCLVAASILILVFDLESDTLSTENTVAGYFVVVFLGIFVGVGVVATIGNGYIIVSEIFPLRIKGVAVAVSSVGLWTGNIVSGELSPFLLTSLGTAGTLLLHSGICVLVLIFVLLLLPETKNLSLEQVDKLFSFPWLQRTNVLFYLTCGKVNKRATLVNTSPTLEDISPLEVSLEQIDVESCDAENSISKDSLL